MEADFHIIVITPEKPVANEAQAITQLLERGAAWRVHLRHPSASIEVFRDILDSIPPRLHPQISVHGHHELKDRYEIAIHGIDSKSCHSNEEIMAEAPGCHYVFLSPIYHSISKPGYGPEETLEPQGLKNVFALGGVIPEKFPELRQRGFDGAALLGWLWEGYPDTFNEKIDILCSSL